MSKRYKLLRDLPETKKDTPYLFCSQPGGEDYYMPVSATNPSVAAEGKIYRAALVESSPDFWELIPEASEQVKEGFVWTDELVQEYAYKIYEATAFTYKSPLDAINKFKASKQSQQREPLLVTGMDVFRGNFEWDDTNKSVVTFKIDPKGKWNVKYDGRPLDQKEFDAELMKAQEYFAKVSLLCEDCGEIGKHKQTCVKSQPTIHHGEDNLQYISSQPETGCPTIDRQEQKGRDWEVFDYRTKSDGSREILSVRRLTDNEVFSVGDMVGYDNGNIRTKQDWAIDNFHIRERDGVMLARSKDNINVELVDKWLYKNGASPSSTERVEVMEITQPKFYQDGRYPVYQFQLSKLTKKERLPLIKNAIEQVLNDDGIAFKTEGTWQLNSNGEKFFNGERLYAQSEYEEAIRKAFDAARETFKGDNVSTQNTKFLRYTTAAYYLQCVTCIHH